MPSNVILGEQSALPRRGSLAGVALMGTGVQAATVAFFTCVPRGRDSVVCYHMLSAKPLQPPTHFVRAPHISCL